MERGHTTNRRAIAAARRPMIGPVLLPLLSQPLSLDLASGKFPIHSLIVEELMEDGFVAEALSTIFLMEKAEGIVAPPGMRKNEIDP
jgi:hypothetical protein